MSFVTLFAWLHRDWLDAFSVLFSASRQLVDGCPFLFQLKHSLSFQYSLSKVLLPLPPCCHCLFCLCGIYHLTRTPFLWNASSFAQLSFCIFQGGEGSVGGSLGNGCLRLWSHSSSPLLDFRVGCRSASVKRRKGRALRRPNVLLAVMPPSMKRKF